MKYLIPVSKWIAILPVALVFYLLPVWGSYYLLFVYFKFEGSIFYALYSFIIPFLGGCMFVLTGSGCCPISKYRGIVAMILTLSFCIFMTVLATIMYHKKIIDESRVYLIVSYISAGIGSIYGCVLALGDYFKYVKQEVQINNLIDSLDDLKIK